MPAIPSPLASKCCGRSRFGLGCRPTDSPVADAGVVTAVRACAEAARAVEGKRADARASGPHPRRLGERGGAGHDSLLVAPTAARPGRRLVLEAAVNGSTDGRRARNL